MRAGMGGACTCVILVAGCYTVAATTSSLNPGAEAIRVGRNDPEPGMREIGLIVAEHGYGCGTEGFEGTYEGALIDLKNKAAQLKADYVQIFTVTEPHFATNRCYANTFRIRATVFRA